MILLNDYIPAMTPLHERLTALLSFLGVALGAYARRLAVPPQPVPFGHVLLVPILPPSLPPLAPALLQLVWNRFARAARRFAVLCRAWQDGTLRPPRRRAPRARPAPAPQESTAHHSTAQESTAQPPAPKPLRLPRGHAWLHRHAPEMAPVTGTLEALVHDAELRRFAAEEPRVGRLLRPLCRALGVVLPPELRLPPRPRRPRGPRPRPARPARPLPLTHPDLGLAPNIIRAVRYWRKKYGRD